MKRSWLILFMGLTALTLLASFFWKRELWGLSAWGAISPFAALLYAIVIAPQFFLKSAPDPFGRVRHVRSSAVRFVLIVVISAAVLWLLRSRHELWGERFTLTAALEKGAIRPAAPLASFIQWAAYRFMNGLFLADAESVLTFFSIAAGTVYALLAFRAATLLFGEDEAEGARDLTAAVLLSGGFIALFFGCGGNTPIAVVAATAFIIEALRFLRGKCSLILPAVLLIAAILSHASALFLALPFAYLCARRDHTRNSWRGPLVAGGLFVLVLAAAEITMTFVAKRPGMIRTIAITLISAPRWATLSNPVNAFFIVGPSSVVAVFLLMTNGRKGASDAPHGTAGRELAFLAVCALSALAAFIIGSLASDGGLRWHVFATTGPALSIYTVWAIRRRFGQASHFKRAAMALFLIGTFHTLPLVLVDAMPRAAEKRLLNLSLAPGRAEMIIADIALDKGDLNTARTWYLASLDKNSANEIVNLRLGRIAMKREEYPEAITHFLNAHELNPSSPHNRFELSEALIGKRWFPEAIAQLETLTVAYPESVAFWRRLGFARNNGDRYESAIVAYEKALTLEPRNEENIRNLVSALLNRAAELQEAKKRDDARALYSRVIEIYPYDWRAYNNLALIEVDEGHIKKAYETLDGALKLHPYESKLHFNMGIVLEKLGRNREALAHMLTARDLDPVYSTAPAYIERLEKKLGIEHQAFPDSQRSPLNDP